MRSTTVEILIFFQGEILRKTVLLYNSRDFNVFLSLRHVDLDINSTTVEISIFFK